MIDTGKIKTNLESIQESIAQAARTSGRQPSEITLMAVTKKKSSAVIQQLADLGIRYIGENYPDETLEKMETFNLLRDRVKLCMIGQLQSRKTRIVAENFAEYHSLDRLKIAQKLNGELKRIDKRMDVFLELNVADEDSKAGWPCMDGKIPGQLMKDGELIQNLEYLNVKGIMSLPPFTENGEENRKYFIQLRNIFETLNQKYGYQLTDLSMGTSSDYRIAIEEGATIVRIGTALTGPREKDEQI
jgi:hypothetical protein